MTQFLWNGFAAGLSYAAVALAVTLVFGLARVVHFAVADFAMVAAMVTVASYQSWESWLLSAALGVATALAMSVASERLVFRFTFGKPINGFLASLAMMFVLRAFVVDRFGPDSRTVVPPFDGTSKIAGVFVRHQIAVNAGLTLLLIGITYAVLQGTRYGMSLRAIADDRRGAWLMGVPVKRVISLSFVLSGTAVALVGFIMSTTGAVDSLTGNGYVLRGFAAALIGGLGNIHGALVAGMLVGIAEHLAIGYGNPGWSQVYLFGIVIALLLFRPEGLWRGAAGAEVHG